MRTKMIFVVFTVAVVGLTGCATGPKSGVVGWRQEFCVGSFAPDIPYTSSDGKQTTFHMARERIAILAFVSVPNNMCYEAIPELAALASRFRVLRITVVQISLPSSASPNKPSEAEIDKIDQGTLRLLCDLHGIAWRAYGKPKSNSAILINEESRVLGIEDIENLEVLANRAEELVETESDFDIGY
jgi:peroxiredoxin